MSIEKTTASVDSQAANLAKRKRELVEEENQLSLQKSKVAKTRTQEMMAAEEAKNRDLVQISKEAEMQVEQSRKLASDRVKSVNENTQKNFQELADKTAGQIKSLNQDAKKVIAETRAKNLEAIQFVESQSEDPFYRVKSFQPTVQEGDDSFYVKVHMPEHEAKNLLVTGDNQTLKLTLARRFQESAKNEETGGSSRTNSYQSVVETVNFPAMIDAHDIKKEYVNGVLTIDVPKHKPKKFT